MRVIEVTNRSRSAACLTGGIHVQYCKPGQKPKAWGIRVPVSLGQRSLSSVGSSAEIHAGQTDENGWRLSMHPKWDVYSKPTPRLWEGHRRGANRVRGRRRAVECRASTWHAFRITNYSLTATTADCRRSGRSGQPALSRQQLMDMRWGGDMSEGSGGAHRRSWGRYNQDTLCTCRRL